MSIKDIPTQFNIDSEEDLRTAIISYFSELGFDADEISCEDSFSVRLGHNAINIDKTRLHGRSDILIARNEEPLAIVETKAPTHDLVDEDAQQAISYARLLATIAPFAIVTNGKETKVYDVLASGLTLIDDPHKSIWYKNNQKISSSILSDDILFEATKTLVAINNGTIEKFCASQVGNALTDLKSNLHQNKKYIPELYVERNHLDENFKKWLNEDLPVFAVVAPSGYGKTNFMCAKVEEVISTNFALFYSCGRFVRSFVDSVRNDFIWEFHREKNLIQIINRLDSISQKADKKLYIFLDAIDENPTGIRAIKNELLDFSKKIQQYPHVRLVISCKTFDWPNIVIDGNQSYNFLAETITPEVTKNRELTTSPVAERIGIHLDEFTVEEAAEATTKYKSAFSLHGDFYGELLEVSRNPLMLRFISETYSEKKEKLPTAVSSLELFNLYLKRKLADLESATIGEIILANLATQIFDTGMRSFPKDEFLSSFNWNLDYEKSLQSLFRVGLLSKSVSDEQEKIGFEFNKLFLYIYLFRVIKLHSLGQKEQVQHIFDYIKTSLGLEALEFYFSAVDQNTAHELFIELSKQNFLLFIQILTGINSIDRVDKSPVPIEHIDNYLAFYNYFRESLFSKLHHVIMPYANVPLGVLFIKDTPMRFRGCTPTNPQSLVGVEDKELIQELVSGPISNGLRDALLPVGMVYLGGIHEFSKHPQKASFKHLMREISSVLSNRLLFETPAPDLLRERIYSILRDSPSIWVQGDDLPQERYWKILGYSSLEELGERKVSSLIDEIDNLLVKFSAKLKNRDNLYPSYLSRSNELLMVLFSLSQMPPNDSLGHLKYSISELYEYHENFDYILDGLTQLLPVIIENYKSIFEINFPELIAYSVFYNNIEKLVLLEALKKGHSEFPTLSYVVAPNVENVSSTRIVAAAKNNSIIDRLHFKSLYGGGYSGGGNCGDLQLDADIGGVKVQDREARTIRTRYPSRTPVLDQVYALISNELRLILNSDRMDWDDSSSSWLVNNKYLQLAARALTRNTNNN